MSRVFLAADGTLGRRIVVKVLPPDATAQVSVERFKREIRLAARLQHPHIVALLSAGETEGVPYYTMPYVQGESLRERLAARGAQPVNETVHVLRDVASALAYAHGEGVVHRDIKPENIILSGGVAVVADFGVAKALAVAERRERPEGDSPRDLPDSLTTLGVALGTPAYMSPEQAAADPTVDPRADIYSFGCVAYEMLTGTSPFAGRPFAQILAAHVQEPPAPVTDRAPLTPPALAALVMSCLAKRPEDRPQSAGALIAALDAITTPSGGSIPAGAGFAQSRLRRPAPTTIAAAIVLALGTAGLAWMARNRETAPVQPGRVTALATTMALEMDPAISPDGKYVAYVAGAPGSYHIHVRQIAGERSIDVSAGLDGEHTAPSWSPDGSQVAFVANGTGFVVSATSGTPKMLVESPGAPIYDVAWSPDGARIAYANTAGLWVKAASGGSARRVVASNWAHSIAWSPDGARIAYVDGIPALLENLSTAPVKVVDVARGTTIAVTTSNVVNLSPAWSPDGRSLFYISGAQGTLDVYRQRLTRDGQPRDSAQRITTGLAARRISLSRDARRMVYDVVRNRSNIWSIEIAAGAGVASMETARQITSDNQRIEALSVSYDARWLAYDSDRGGNADIYRIPVEGGEAVQVTTNPGGDFAPSWLPDRRRLLFYSTRSGHREVYSIGVDGSDEQQLTHLNDDLYSPELAPDGSRLFAYAGSAVRRAVNERYDVVLERDAAGHWTNMRRVTPPNVQARWFHLSRDGAWLGYVTTATGTKPGVDATARAMRLDGRDDHVMLDLRPREQAMYVAFGSDPSTAFVMTQRDDRRYGIYSVPIAGGTPRLLVRDDPTHRISRWDFASDGRRLFFTLAADESDVYLMELSR